MPIIVDFLGARLLFNWDCRTYRHTSKGKGVLILVTHATTYWNQIQVLTRLTYQIQKLFYLVVYASSVSFSYLRGLQLLC